MTTNVSINFLRKPAPADLIGKARLIKLGKRLAVGEVALYSEGESEMVAHATGTYSIPARGEGAIDGPGAEPIVTPAKAGVQSRRLSPFWMPACAGMTGRVYAVS